MSMAAARKAQIPLSRHEAAKPIIDVDVVISSRNVLQHAIERLAIVGYSHEGNLGIPGREAFAAPRGEIEHHLYVCAADSAELRRHITFRDKLRSDQTAAQQYAEMEYYSIISKIYHSLNDVYGFYAAYVSDLMNDGDPWKLSKWAPKTSSRA